MNAQYSRKSRSDGVIDLLTLGVDPSQTGTQSLEDFCETRRLSLRSRLELVEHVCSLVCAAHDAGTGFLRISSKTVNIDYAGGGLSIDIPGSITIPRAREGERATPGTGRFSSGQLIRAANVVELGQMLADLTGRVARLDPSIALVVQRATSMQSDCRLESVLALRDEVAALRRAREICSESAPALAGQAEPGFAQRWSWAD